MVKLSLEGILGEERAERIRDSQPYQYLVDTGAMVAYSTPIAMANEIFVADMEVLESLKARGIATIVNSLTSRPYGMYRDFVFTRCETTKESGFLKKGLTDLLAFITFQAPLYGGIIYASGAEPKDALIGTAVITALSPVIGRTYGAFLDWFRKRFGTKAAYEIAEEALNPAQDDSTNTPLPQ